jgi:endonuclease-8
VPEGHTLRRLAMQFTAEFAGEKVSVSSPQGRFEAGAELLDGHVLVRADSAGKHLFLEFDDRRRLHVHLGLYGKFTFGPAPAPPPVGQVRVRLETADRYADLRGATACEVLTRAESRAVVARLGPDPLRRDGSREEFARRLRRSRMPVAALLMDQSVIAGVGNVYRAESLFRARLSPDLPGRDVDEDTAGALWDDLRALLRDGVKRGAIVTTLPEHRPRGARRGTPPEEHRHYVYRRTGLPCRVCGTPVATRVLVARNLFWCPSCQA